jgi:hypothetical protein
MISKFLLGYIPTNLLFKSTFDVVENQTLKQSSHSSNYKFQLEDATNQVLNAFSEYWIVITLTMCLVLLLLVFKCFFKRFLLYLLRKYKCTTGFFGFLRHFIECGSIKPSHELYRDFVSNKQKLPIYNQKNQNKN